MPGTCKLSIIPFVFEQLSRVYANNCTVASSIAESESKFLLDPIELSVENAIMFLRSRKDTGQITARVSFNVAYFIS